MMINKRLVAVLCLAFCGAQSRGQTAANQSFASWYHDRLVAHIDQMISPSAKDVVGMNGKGTDRQKESPASDSRSTSLVDQSSATDFFSVAANVIPVTPGLSQFIPPTGSTTSDSSAAGSTTATASLYALLAGLNKKNPTDPQFYKDHIASRRFSFTVGTAASKQATDNSDKPAAVYGVKGLLINWREIYTTANQKRIQAVEEAARKAAESSVRLEPQIQDLMYKGLHKDRLNPDGSFDNKSPDYVNFVLTSLSDAGFEATLSALPAETKKQIEDLIESNIGVFADYKKKLDDTYDQISKSMQMSISYTADIRDAKGNNDHRAELIFDYGLSPRINWTVNASADYTDRKSAADSKGGRFATSFQGDLTKSNSAWGKTPIRLTFSGEGKWQTSQKPQYTFESKLSIPLASGIDLPIVYRYANRIAQIDQTSSEARLGLSIDISRLAQTFK